MINLKNMLKRPDYFVCDRCGQKYDFSGSYLVVLKGQEFCPFEGELTIAECDLCRDCAGQTAKFEPDAEAQLQSVIAVIDAATQRL